MKAGKSIDKNLDQALGRLGSPSIEGMDFARERVRQTLRSSANIGVAGLPAQMGADSPLDARPVSLWNLRQPFLIAAAAVFSLAVLSTVGLQNAVIPTQAVVESADGLLYRLSAGSSRVVKTGETLEAPETLRWQGGGMLALADGSRLEMRSKSELALETAGDGVLLQLNGGSIIV